MRRWVGFVTVGITLGALAIHAPAQAVPGLQYVSLTSASDSSATKSVVVYCPAGTVSIGGGAFLTGALGQATIRQVVPGTVLGRPALIVIGAEDADGYSGNWTITGTSVCIPPPAGLRYVRVSVSDPGLVWATADCVGQRIIGSGYAVSHTAKAQATGMQISRNRAYLSVELSGVPGGLSPITGTVTAVCADSALPGMVEITASTAEDSVNPKTATAACPAGTQLVQIGGDMFRFRLHSVIDDLRIGPPNLAVFTGYEDQIGNPDVWALEVRATCAA